MLYFALFYALIFWVVAFKKPLYALALIWAMAPLQTDIGAGIAKFSLTEIHLLMVAPLLMLRLRTARSAFSLGALQWPIAAYLGISLLSTLTHWRGSVAVVSMLQMVLYVVVTLQVFQTLLSPAELQRVPQGLIWTGALWSLIGIATHFNFIGHLKNAFGASLAAAFLVAFDLWLAAPKSARRHCILVGALIILMGLTLSLSRGGWLGAASGLLVIVALRRAWGTFLKATVLAAPLLFLCWQLLPQRSQGYAFSFDSSRYNIQARLKSLRQAQENFASDRVLGVGVGLRKQYDATNLVWSTLAETGVLGFVAFAWIFGAFYLLVWRTRGRLKTSDPAFSLLSIGAALMTCKLMHGMVDHYWSRGAITLAWGGAGMVLVASRLPAQRALALARQRHALSLLPIHAYAPLPATPPPAPFLHAYAPLSTEERAEALAP